MSLIPKNVKEHLFVDVETKYLKKEQLPLKLTYKQIQAYIETEYDFKVTPLYIAQVKDELGLEKQYSFVDGNVAAEKRPHCSREKHDAIVAAFKHFMMI